MSAHYRNGVPGIDPARAPAEPGPADAVALVTVLDALKSLTPDARKRVLHAAEAFYRVER